MQFSDPNTGLFIQDRNENVVKATAKVENLNFQIGETVQIQSGGLLKATPHAVLAGRMENVGRTILAVFMEPSMKETLNVP